MSDELVTIDIRDGVADVRLPVPVISAIHGVAYGGGAQIASKSPDAIRAGKQLLESAWHADERTGLELEASLQMALIGSENQVEAIKANFENRAPDFKDPD